MADLEETETGNLPGDAETSEEKVPLPAVDPGITSSSKGCVRISSSVNLPKKHSREHVTKHTLEQLAESTVFDSVDAEEWQAFHSKIKATRSVISVDDSSSPMVAHWTKMLKSTHGTNAAHERRRSSMGEALYAKHIVGSARRTSRDLMALESREHTSGARGRRASSGVGAIEPRDTRRGSRDSRAIALSTEDLTKRGSRANESREIIKSTDKRGRTSQLERQFSLFGKPSKDTKAMESRDSTAGTFHHERLPPKTSKDKEGTGSINNITGMFPPRSFSKKVSNGAKSKESTQSTNGSFQHDSLVGHLPPLPETAVKLSLKSMPKAYYSVRPVGQTVSTVPPRRESQHSSGSRSGSSSGHLPSLPTYTPMSAKRGTRPNIGVTTKDTRKSISKVCSLDSKTSSIRAVAMPSRPSLRVEPKSRYSRDLGYDDVVQVMKRIISRREKAAYRMLWRRAIRMITNVVHFRRHLSERTLESELQHKTFLDIGDSATKMVTPKHCSLFPSTDHSRSAPKITAEGRRILTRPPESRTQEEVARALVDLQYSRDFCCMPLTVQREMAKWGIFEQVTKRRVVIKCGHVPTHYYFILAGQAQVTRTEADARVTETLLSQGHGFGKEAILKKTVHIHSVISRKDLQLLAIPKQRVLIIFSDAYSNNGQYDLREIHVNFLAQLSWMKHWPIHHLLRHPSLTSMAFYRDRQVIVEDSSRCSNLYVVRSGKCSVFMRVDMLQCTWTDFARLLAPDGTYIDDHLARLEEKRFRKLVPHRFTPMDDYSSTHLDKLWDLSVQHSPAVALGRVRTPSVGILKMPVLPSHSPSDVDEGHSSTTSVETVSEPAVPQSDAGYVLEVPTQEGSEVVRRKVTFNENNLEEVIPKKSKIVSLSWKKTPPNTFSSPRPSLQKPVPSPFRRKSSQGNRAGKAIMSRKQAAATKATETEEDTNGSNDAECEANNNAAAYHPCVQREYRSCLQRRVQYKVPGYCLPPVCPQPKVSVKVTTQAPSFVVVYTLHKGDVFGFDQMTMPMVEPEKKEKHVSSLISCGAEVIAMDKEFFLRYADVRTQQLVYNMSQALPSPFQLKQKQKYNMAWSLYMDKLFEEMESDWSKKRRHHGLFFQPGPLVDPKASVGLIVDPR